MFPKGQTSNGSAWICEAEHPICLICAQTFLSGEKIDTLVSTVVSKNLFLKKKNLNDYRFLIDSSLIGLSRVSVDPRQEEEGLSLIFAGLVQMLALVASVLVLGKYLLIPSPGHKTGIAINFLQLLLLFARLGNLRPSHHVFKRRAECLESNDSRASTLEV